MDNTQFKFKIEQKVQKAINRLFLIKENNLSDTEIIEKENIVLMDNANICMLIAKSIEAKISIKRFTDKEDLTKEPTLNYTSSCKCSCKYSTTYMLNALKIFEVLGDSLTISLNQEYPATLENEHFKVIIAPRVEY